MCYCHRKEDAEPMPWTPTLGPLSTLSTYSSSKQSTPSPYDTTSGAKCTSVTPMAGRCGAPCSCCELHAARTHWALSEEVTAP